MLKTSSFVLSLILVLSLSACSTAPTVDQKEKDRPPLNIKQVSYSDLPAWHSDNLNNFAQAYERSCIRILKKNSQDNFGPDGRFGRYQDWQISCRKFAKINKSSAQAIRAFFEQNFVPYQAFAGSDPNGLFTGYYEASLKGSRTRQGSYQYPLRARPDDSRDGQPW